MLESVRLDCIIGEVFEVYVLFVFLFGLLLFGNSDLIWGSKIGISLNMFVGVIILLSSMYNLVVFFFNLVLYIFW